MFGAAQLVYVQLIYAMDLVQEKAAGDPSILTSDTQRAAADGDFAAALAGGEEALFGILAINHSGRSAQAFQADV